MIEHRKLIRIIWMLYTIKVNALFSLGRYEEAIIWYDKSLVIEPDDRDILEAKRSAVYQLSVQNALDSSLIR